MTLQRSPRVSDRMRRSLLRVTTARTAAPFFAASLVATARRALTSKATVAFRRNHTRPSMAAAAMSTSTKPAAAAASAAASAAAPADDSVLIAVGQMNSSADIDANVQTVRELAARAAARQAKMLFLPECFAFLGPSPQHSIAMAQPLTGELMGRYRAIAQQHKLWLSLGGFQTKLDTDDLARKAAAASKAPAVSAALALQHSALNPSGERIFNAHVIVDAQGRVAARYNKIHLFDVHVPNGGPSLCESAFTEAGSEVVTCDSPAGKLGLSVCYDLRFPELYGALTRAGAQVLTVPAAFTYPTGVAHWHALLRARAIETQCYVVAAAQTGKHNTTIPAGSPLATVKAAASAAPTADGKEKAAPTPRETFGHACIIDPWGAIVAEVSEGVGLAFAEVQLSRVAKVRAGIPVAQHRRAELYAAAVVDVPNAATPAKL